MFEETKDELQMTRRDLLKNSKGASASLAAQAILQRVETERDNAYYEARNLANERDSLKERLKVSLNLFRSSRKRWLN